jgi:hypothetical protein
MNRALLLPLVFLFTAGCIHEVPSPSVGYLPVDAFGNSVVGQDPALASLNAATIAFAYPGTMQGRPAQMALAIASLDAMAGQFSAGGRWMAMDWISQQEMLDARDQVRAILGVPQDAPSQSVVDQLVAASHALDKGDQAAALAALSGPDFTKPPAQTLAILTRFPRVQIANRATMDANLNFFPATSGTNSLR